jgi:HAD superfamily hydrolase (TIGR01509 family)
MTRPLIIFDFDGLTVDTETVELLAWETIYREYGCEIPLDSWLEVVGTIVHHFDPLESLETQLGEKVDRLLLTDRQRQLFHDAAYSAPLQPGIAEAIELIAREGWRLAMATSSGNGWAQNHLARRGILEAFELIITRDEVPQVKPDPAPYRRVVELLEADPTECLVFEDSRNGIIAAKGAGLYCVAVPNQVTCRMDLSLADEMVESLLGYPFATTFERLRGRKRLEPSCASAP